LGSRGREKSICQCRADAKPCGNGSPVGNLSDQVRAIRQPTALPAISPSLHFANPLSTDYSLVPSPKYGGIIRNCAMKSAAEYRAYAEQCIESAKTARSQEERDALLEMARAWIEQAHQVEHSSTVQKPAKPEPR
jgi:hypothetical protein